MFNDNLNIEGIQNSFPRELTQFEKELLFSVLPENKPGYKFYRERISSLKVIGEINNDGENIILGNGNDLPDDSSFSLPVFAAGTAEFNGGTIDILIYEEADNMVAASLIKSSDKDFSSMKRLKAWSYSEWNPGDNAPNDQSGVREIPVIPYLLTMAVSSSHKKIWINEKNTGINYLIPVSNFYNYLMLMKNIRDSEIVSKPGLFFTEHEKYSDEEIASAFLIYNKKFKKLGIDYSIFENRKEVPVKGKKLFSRKG